MIQRIGGPEVSVLCALHDPCQPDTHNALGSVTGGLGNQLIARGGGGRGWGGVQHVHAWRPGAVVTKVTKAFGVPSVYVGGIGVKQNTRQMALLSKHSECCEWMHGEKTRSTPWGGSLRCIFDDVGCWVIVAYIPARWRLVMNCWEHASIMAASSLGQKTMIIWNWKAWLLLYTVFNNVTLVLKYNSIGCIQRILSVPDDGRLVVHIFPFISLLFGLAYPP